MEHNLLPPTRKLINRVTFAEMEAYLTNPETRILDSRMLETSEDFIYAFQVLNADGTITSCEMEVGSTQPTVLDLFKLQYRNNARNNPGLYGLLDTGVEDNG